MGAFNAEEIEYMTRERRLARIATVGADGMPHVVPVGWSYNAEQDTIDVGGHDMAATKKFRDVKLGSRAAIVIDDVVPPWLPRGIEVRGRAEALEDNGTSPPAPVIRIHPDHVRSWGLSKS
jgi:pyridoxamine 5'-phosphate oxidase family protein